MTNKGCPTKLNEEHLKNDQFTDSGSDNKNKFEMKVSEINEMMNEFEKGDNKMKDLRSKKTDFLTDYVKEKERLNSNMR